VKEATISLNLYKSAANEGSSLTEVKLKGQLATLVKDNGILEADLKVSTPSVIG